jgi:hypothetical protein
MPNPILRLVLVLVLPLIYFCVDSGSDPLKLQRSDSGSSSVLDHRLENCQCPGRFGCPDRLLRARPYVLQERTKDGTEV